MFHFLLLLSCIISFVIFISACDSRKKLDSLNYYCQKFEIKCTKNNSIISFKTSQGNFEVELFGEDYPLTVSTFIHNIENKLYNNRKFYKIINYYQSKVIHAGINPDNKNYAGSNKTLSKLPPSIPLEIKFKKENEPKYRYQIKDPYESLNLVNMFENGSVAMVRIGPENSSSTEFFFVTNKISELNGRYSVFGKITKGLEVLNKIQQEDLIYNIEILD